ncbi:MAG: CBS domain-containing protein [Halobacteria archaeon]|nr:CBS domain-containing protein [Halobacteria archaeon]
MDISDIFTDDFVGFDHSTKVSKLASAFEDPELEAIVVTDDNEYKGIVTRRQLMFSTHHKSGRKADSVVKHVPKLNPTEDVREVARLMVESNSKVLPVFEDENLVGVVTTDGLLKEVTSELNVLSVEDVYTRDLIAVTSETSVGEVINIFRENMITRVPVLEKGNLEGIVSQHDLIGFVTRKTDRSQGGSNVFGSSLSHGGFGSREGDIERLLDLPSRDVMVSPVETVTPEERLGDAVERMFEGRQSSLVVVDPDTENPIGIVTKTDVLKSLTWTEDEQIDIQITNIDLLDTLTRDDVADMVLDIAEKYSDMDLLHTHVYLQKHKENVRGNPLIFVRIILYTDKGQFIGTAEGYGAEYALSLALDKLERNVLSAKQYGRNKKQTEEMIEWIWREM